MKLEKVKVYKARDGWNNFIRVTQRGILRVIGRLPSNRELDARLTKLERELDFHAAGLRALREVVLPNPWNDAPPEPAPTPNPRGLLPAKAIARICHEANAALCAEYGDFSHFSWRDAPEWQRNSAVNGVKFLQANPTAGPDAAHENWRRHKEENGWTYGPVKDAEMKQHPCMVPFEQLPAHQQLKDVLFHAIVRALS